MLAADGSLITDFYDRDRVPVAADAIAPVMGAALVDVEDSRFYSHGGVDPIGTLRALVADLSSGGAAQGGSTLTQQLVKQVLLQDATTTAGQQAATADTVARKLTEARLALAVDARLSKSEILTRYLNTVYFGHGAYGVQAAARTYFSVDASALTPLQAATLAGLVQNPSADDPIAHPDAAQARRDVVLQRMHDHGDLDDADLAADTAAPVATTPTAAPPQGCAQALGGGFFCSYLRTYLTGTLGLTDAELDGGGLTIRTTLAPGVQQAGDAAVVRTVPRDSSLAAVYDVVQPGTGHVLAMSVNRTYGCTGDGCTSVDLPTAAARGSGSTYKLFTAAYALQHGYTASFTQTTSDPYTSTVYKRDGGTRGVPYTVGNAGHYPATLDLADALVESSNTFFVGLEDHLGSVAGPVHEAQTLGLASLTDDDAQQIVDGEQGSFTLGPQATSPLDLADAYATVFSGGTRCDPTPVTAVLGPGGTQLAGSGEPWTPGTTARPGRCRRRWPTPSPRSCAVTSSPTSAPPPGRGSPGTTSPARPAPPRATCRSPSWGPLPTTPRACWCSTRTRTSTSVASAGEERPDLARRDGPGARPGTDPGLPGGRPDGARRAGGRGLPVPGGRPGAGLLSAAALSRCRWRCRSCGRRRAPDPPRRVPRGRRRGGGGVLPGPSPSVPSVSVTLVTAVDSATPAPGTAAATARAAASLPGG
ncbi:transglycosylase domain-containing protein [Klenkia terrae]|uniref:transglycosylase domain-containing protein n=1 Tax=Klenkia terrae TaxID=1052259 RepID=UPI003608A151